MAVGLAVPVVFLVVVAVPVVLAVLAASVVLVVFPRQPVLVVLVAVLVVLVALVVAGVPVVLVSLVALFAVQLAPVVLPVLRSHFPPRVAVIVRLVGWPEGHSQPLVQLVGPGTAPAGVAVVARERVAKLAALVPVAHLLVVLAPSLRLVVLAPVLLRSMGAQAMFLPCLL